MITKIHAYLVKEIRTYQKMRKKKSAEFVIRMCQLILGAFWTQNLRGEEGFDRIDSMLEGLGAGWTASFMAKVYPALSRYLIKEILKAVTELSIVMILALFVMFRAQSLVKGPVVLLTKGVQN